MPFVGTSYYIIKTSIKIRTAIIRNPMNEPTAIPAITKFESPSSCDIGVGDEVENKILVVLGVFIELDNVEENAKCLKRKNI